MFNFTFISKKNFLSFLNKANYTLVNILNNLKLSNLRRITRLFFIDKRVIITFIIVFFSVFVHLSTPAFYKDSWVKGIVKNQFEKEFNFKIEFSEKLSYAIFPIPHFHFKDVKFVIPDRDIAKIETIKVYLTFSKFLDKNKMNIQDIKINKAKFDFYKQDLKNFLIFFNKKINEKKITILNSNIFLKNENDDIFTIISIDKTKSFYDNIELINKLDVEGEIFNNSFKLNIENNYLNKNSYFDLVLNKLNKRFINTLDSSKNKKVGNLSYLDSRKKYDTKYEFNNNTLRFYSEEKVDDNFFYKGVTEFSPFSSNLEINLKNIYLSKLFNNESFLIEILKANLFSSENLNFKIQLKAKNILDHRKLKNLNLNINYENQVLNFDKSNLLLDEILSIRLVDSEFKNSKNKQYFFGEFEILINDYSSLYSFFQTKKEFRKEIKSIKLYAKYDFLRNNLSFEKVKIDGNFSENIANVISQFNQENKVLKNRIDLRNFFNSIVEEL